MTLAVLILAAGQGTRMLSKKQKILHDVGGKPMVAHVFDAAQAISEQQPVLVVGPGEAGVRGLFGNGARYVVQPEQLGTGNATAVAHSLLQGQADQVIVTYGDMPLLRGETMAALARKQQEMDAAVVMLSIMGDPTSSFGRVVRAARGKGSVMEIVEVAEAKRRENTEEILAIRELNAGVYCFNGRFLWDNINDLPLRQARSGPEYYLTDMIEIAVAQNRLVEAISVTDPDECLGAGTRPELVDVEKAFRRRANNHWLARGVTLVDPNSTFIDQDVEIGQDTIIWPNTYLQGKTAVGQDCVLGPNTIIRDSNLGNGCIVEQAVVESQDLVGNTKVAPFTHLKT
ncbi:MAG: NTP transferase domain-containing protein [Chloroflexota bacterium]